MKRGETSTGKGESHERTSIKRAGSKDQLVRVISQNHQHHGNPFASDDTQPTIRVARCASFQPRLSTAARSPFPSADEHERIQHLSSLRQAHLRHLEWGCNHPQSSPTTVANSGCPCVWHWTSILEISTTAAVPISATTVAMMSNVCTSTESCVHQLFRRLTVRHQSPRPLAVKRTPGAGSKIILLEQDEANGCCASTFATQSDDDPCDPSDIPIMRRNGRCVMPPHYTISNPKFQSSFSPPQLGRQ